MSYSGVAVPIPMGQGGLHTDESPVVIPPTDLILANNVVVQHNLIEKFAGVAKFNLSAIPSGVYGMYDFWPTANIANRRLIVLGGDGKTYAIDNNGTVTEITPAGGAPATLSVTNQVFFLTGGSEANANNKKLFIFTGANKIQVISGTGVTRTNIATAPGDWSDPNHPSFGVIYQNRLFVSGMPGNNPHAVYVSLATNHEDFTTTPLTFFIYPGEGRNIIGALIFKSRLFFAKYPSGTYYLESVSGTGVDPTKWFFVKTENNFGFASRHSAIPVLNDVLIKNASDGITSVGATLNFGDIIAGDLNTTLKIEQYVRDNTNPDGVTSTHSLYYPAKKLAMFTYRSTQGTSNDRILMYRVDTQLPPKATFINCLAPNCLALRQDTHFIERPVMGSLDGFVYMLDQNNFNINNKGYLAEFQTPHMDFGFASVGASGVQVGTNAGFATKNKNFRFLELKYVPLGDWNLYADIIIDSKFYETIVFPMTGGALLGDVNPGANDFILALNATDAAGSFLASDELLSLRKRIRGTGRTISIRLYNSGLDQGFRIATMVVSFTPSSEQQR